MSPLNQKMDKMGEKLDKSSEGTLCSLRNDILVCYYNCRDKGYRNNYDTINMYDLNKAYVALGGNSFVEDTMQHFENLPTEEEYKDKQNSKKARSERKHGSEAE